MLLKVTEVTETLVTCGWWTFDRETGVEEDPELGWGRSFGVTGSFLKDNGDDDAELWADCSKPDENGERCAIYIEKKTFGGFEGPWTKWCQDLKEFAEQVDHCH